MNYKLLLILFMLSVLTADTMSAQNIEGEWYTPLRNKLLFISISKDSILLKKYSFEGALHSNEASFKVEKRITCSYIVSQIKDSVLLYSLFDFKLTNDSRSYLNTQSMSETYPTIEEAENAIAEMRKEPLFITLLSKEEMQLISQKKDVSEMTVRDFKKYASKIIEEDKYGSMSLSMKYKLSYLYMESGLRIILADVGYNCLTQGKNIDTMLETFSKNPETKEIFLEMMK